MKCLHDFSTRLFWDLALTAIVFMKKGFQVGVIGKYFGTNEVEQCKKAPSCVILEGSASDQEAATGDKHADDLRQDGIDILDAMCLINDKYKQNANFLRVCFSIKQIS